MVQTMSNEAGNTSIKATGTRNPAYILREKIDIDLVTRGRVVIIGLGGIGTWLSRGVTAFVAGIANASKERIDMLLVDGDAYEPANAYRMEVSELGNKAEVMGKQLLNIHPNVDVRWKGQYVTPENVSSVIQEGDVVLLAVDNHKTRKLVAEHCGTLQTVTLISGGNDGVEEGMRGSYGNVQVHVREDGKDITAPITKFHPEIQEPADKRPDELDCLEAAMFGSPQLTVVNMAVACAMSSALMRLMMPEGSKMYDEIALDCWEGVSQATAY